MEADPVPDQKYAVGQVWAYQTRANETDSKLYIVRIEENEKIGPIYNIYLDGLAIENPHIAGSQDSLPHAPVSAETLDASVTGLIEVRQNDLPDISEGFDMWKEAFDSGDAGVFTIKVSEIVQYIEDIVNGRTEN